MNPQDIQVRAVVVVVGNRKADVKEQAHREGEECGFHLSWTLGERVLHGGLLPSGMSLDAGLNPGLTGSQGQGPEGAGQTWPCPLSPMQQSRAHSRFN